MKLIINGQTEEFENSTSAIGLVLSHIKQILKQRKLELSHLVVDGTPVYQDYENYLNEKIETTSEIVVETLKLKPLIDETIDSAFAYIVTAITQLRPLAETYYQSPGSDAWNRLADLFEGIGWLFETMNRIDQIDQLQLYVSSYDKWNEYVQTLKVLNNNIIELEKAMLNKDHVLIGDLILYEILPIFEAAEEKLRFLVPSGGTSC